MGPKGKWKDATVCSAAAVLLTCFLVQPIDCYRLMNTERQKGRNGAKAIDVQLGVIVFGKDFVRGSGLQPQIIDGVKKSSSYASVEDGAAHQADSPVWSQGQMQDASSKDALWKKMVTSLQCVGDEMTFKAVGPGASQFVVVQEHAPPTPLSQVPSTCGYSMQRNFLALTMMVPYNGCNMVQEAGCFVLPLLWCGIPVTLWCPAPAPTSAAPKEPVNPAPKLPPYMDYLPPATMAPPQYPFHPPYYPPGQVQPQPAAQMTTAKTQSPKLPLYIHYFPPPTMAPPQNPYQWQLQAPLQEPAQMTIAKPQSPKLPPYMLPKYPSQFPPHHHQFMPYLPQE